MGSKTAQARGWALRLVANILCGPGCISLLLCAQLTGVFRPPRVPLVYSINHLVQDVYAADSATPAVLQGSVLRALLGQHGALLAARARGAAAS